MEKQVTTVNVEVVKTGNKLDYRYYVMKGKSRVDVKFQELYSLAPFRFEFEDGTVRHRIGGLYSKLGDGYIKNNFDIVFENKLCKNRLYK